MAYEFTTEGYRSFSEAIIAANGDQATITSILADMQDTVTNNITALETANKNVESLTSENERLKTANMNLFLRIGESTANDKGGSGSPKPESEMDADQYMENFFKD